MKTIITLISMTLLCGCPKMERDNQEEVEGLDLSFTEEAQRPTPPVQPQGVAEQPNVEGVAEQPNVEGVAEQPNIEEENPTTSKEQGDFTDGTEVGETMNEEYAETDVNCGGTLVDFPDHSFVMKFDISENKQIDLPVVTGVYSADFYISWGDGICERNISTHQYTNDAPNEVTVKVIGRIESFGKFNSTNYNDKLVEVVNFGDLGWKKLVAAFAFSEKLRVFAVKHTDTSKLIDMTSMFNGAKNLASLDLSKFDTSNVFSMRSLFKETNSLVNLDLSKFDTSKVTDMYEMFYNSHLLGTGEGSKGTIDLSSFDTSSVTNMSFMFSGANGLTSLDLSNFNTSNVMEMKYMFYDIENLISLDLSSFNTSKVGDMTRMFYITPKLKRLNLSNFGMKYSHSLGRMLNHQALIERVNLGKWDLSSSIVDDNQNFDGAGWSLNNLPIVYCEDGTQPDNIPCSAPPMIVTFETASAGESVTLGVLGENINVIWGDGAINANTTHTYAEPGVHEVWIENSNTLTEINNSWSNNLTKVNSLGDISNVTTFIHPFKNKSNLKLFSGYSKLNNAVTDISSMFEGAISLLTVDLSQFSPSNVTNTSNMFKGAASLKNVNLGEINPIGINTDNMFTGTPVISSNENKILYCSKEYDENETESNWTVSIGGDDYQCENNLMPLVIEVAPVAGQEFQLAARENIAMITDWGDNSGLMNSSNGKVHTYGNEGNRIIKIWGKYNASGRFSDNSKDKLISIKSFGHKVVSYALSMFEGTSISRVSGYGQFGSLNMEKMFKDCSQLVDVNLTKLDTSSVYQMKDMFQNSPENTIIDLGYWETNRVIGLVESFIGESSTLYCDNDDDADREGNEIIIFNNVFSCSSRAE